jgi:integrase/recombinase XerD
MPKPGTKWRRMDPGSLRAFVVEFTNDLAGLGHTDLTVGGYEDAVRHFAEWLKRSDIALVDVDDKAVARFAGHRCKCTGNRRHRHVSAKYVRRVRRFVRFLAQRGITKMNIPSAAKVISARVAEFQDFLRQHRGISERTIDRHGRMVMRLLPDLGDDPWTYDAELIRRAIVTEAGRSSRPYVKTMMTALRGYLRFLAANGACRPGLDRAVPAVPQWRLSALPRYLATADVERLIASCDLSKTHGIRDRAILLLLARLGLRAGESLACVSMILAGTREHSEFEAKGAGKFNCPCRRTLVTRCSITWKRPGRSSTTTEYSCDRRRLTDLSLALAPSLTSCGLP